MTDHPAARRRRSPAFRPLASDVSRPDTVLFAGWPASEPVFILVCSPFDLRLQMYLLHKPLGGLFVRIPALLSNLSRIFGSQSTSLMIRRNITWKQAQFLGQV